MIDRLEVLKTLAREWGGEICEVSHQEFEALEDIDIALYTHNDLGVDYKAKKIYYTTPVDWAEVIHEMGHVFACPKPPEAADEWGFFGWEYALARLLKGVPYWKKSMKDYSLYDISFNPKAKPRDLSDFGRLTTKEQATALRAAVKEARLRGVLNSWQPLAIR